jgi:hypothetical protein
MIYIIRLYFLILLLFSLNLKAQKSLSQKDWFESGEKFLKKKNYEFATSQFYMAEKYGSDTIIKKVAKKKIDSILPIAQKKIINELKGDWRLKELNYDPYPGKFTEHIRITDNDIVFYKLDSNNTEVKLRKEQIRFLSYDSLNDDFSARIFIFKNSEVWTFSVSNKKRIKKLYPEIYRDSDGNRQHLLDERFIIIDKKARKKAMEKEIYTFYVKK